MEDKEKILKESFYFSKFESVPKFDTKSFSYKEVRFMSKLSKIIVSLVVVVALVGVGLFLLYDSLTVKVKKESVSQNIQKEELIKQPQKISATVSMVYGDVKVRNIGVLKDIEIGYQLSDGDIITTSSDSECEIQIVGKGVVKVKENSEVSFNELVSTVNNNKENIVELMKGNVRIAVKKLSEGEEFKVKTEAAVAAVRGTVFSVSFYQDKGAEVVVAEGKVAVSVNSKAIEQLKEKTSPELRDKLVKLENISEVVVGEGEVTKVTPEMQKIVDASLSKVVESVSTKGTVSEKEIELLSKELKSVSKQVAITSIKAPRDLVIGISKDVSRSLIISEVTKTVKVSFVPEDNKYATAELFIDGVSVAKLPSVRILEQDKEYKIEVKYKGDIILSEKMKFDKDVTITIGKGIKPETKEVLTQTVEKVKDRLIETKDFGISATIKYGKWIEVTSEMFVPTTGGIVVYQGDSVRKLGINGLAFGYSKNYIVALAKDDNDYLVVSIYNVNGKLIDKINLGSQTKGTLIVGSPAIVGNKVFVPSIEGLWMIDIDSGARSFIKIGSVYSDVAKFGNTKVATVNEIGEVYEISTDGVYTKIAQLSTTTLRKASISTDKDSIFIFSKGTLYIASVGKEVMNVSTGISTDCKPIVVGDKVVLYSDRKVIVMDKNANLVYNISLSGIKGMPYVEGKYLVITANDGVHVYDFISGKEIWNYDVIGNVSLIKDNKLYVASDDKVYVLSLE